ncbi:MAG: hypothetical protein J6V33_03565 [Bacteroidales bacterium]|nr:hypothetical protein [Bacteroidales bacterium]
MNKILVICVAMFAITDMLFAQDDSGLYSQLGCPEFRKNVKGNESFLLRDDSTVFSNVDVSPMFPGGEDSLKTYIIRHFNFNVSQECDIIGTIIVAFIVEPDGSITDIVRIRDIGCNAVNELINVVKTMPKWIPGLLKGKPVRVRHFLTFRYEIQ